MSRQVHLNVIARDLKCKVATIGSCFHQNPVSNRVLFQSVALPKRCSLAVALPSCVRMLCSRSANFMATSHQPVYLQIAEQLRQNIRDGLYRPGDRIPTEAQLSERFGVNRHTLRRALGLLQSEGLLRADQGRGTFVASRPIRYPIGKRVRFRDTLVAHGHTVTYKQVRSLQLPADVKVAEALQIEVGATAALIERLGCADSDPISISTQYFPADVFPGILDHFKTITSVSKLFQTIYERDHLRLNTYVSAQTIDPHDAQLLELPLNAPVMVTESINVDQHGRVIEYGVTRFRGDRVELILENDLSAI